MKSNLTKPDTDSPNAVADAKTIGKLMALSLIVGILAGYGALVFRMLIQNVDTGMFGTALNFMSGGNQTLRFWLIPLIPAFGGLVVGIIGRYLAPEVYYTGIPEVIEAVDSDKWRHRHRTVWAKLLSSSITLGTGGSAGREGPIVMVGSSFGSAVANLLRLPLNQSKILLAAGAAAGIGATFNAPVAGVIFAIEVLTHSFRLISVMPIIMATVSSTIIFRLYRGAVPPFTISDKAIADVSSLDPTILLMFVVVGILGGIVAFGFLKMLFHTDNFFDRMKMPTFMKPALGGLLVGIIALSMPQSPDVVTAGKPAILGVGYETIVGFFETIPAVETLLVLLVLKLLATALTIGSGNSGGSFAPSLFLGAALGGTITALFHRYGYDMGGIENIFLMAGMGAVVSGVTLAPLSTFIILFEMSEHYEVLFPVMISSVLAAYVVKRLGGVSVYGLRKRDEVVKGQDPFENRKTLRLTRKDI